MKTNSRKLWPVAVATLSAASFLTATGCGDDNSPPEDKSYYSGPMKGKGAAGSGPTTDADKPITESGNKME
ncbi:MAG TPA: hypothetical protein PLX06_08335 [Fimbriimonadaceae bacterium]|nr:hypothetical protein [Fimbriimonadaceae bacterium]